MSTTATFRALRLHAPPTAGGAPQARFETLHDDDLGAGDVTLAVAYSSINYKDALVLAGRNGIVSDYPRIGGIDLSGTVLRSADPRWRAGDRVVAHGLGLGVTHDGGHAERARMPGDWLMPLPAGISLFEAATIGAAGYTAALALHLMEHNGLTVDAGAVLVTGATGGVASVAIDILAQRDYRVVAISGKDDAHAELRELGAAEVLSRHTLPMGDKPLEKGRWAGAVDSVGGPMLAWITRSMLPQGVITAFGNAGGAELATTVMPFILRGVRLLGISGAGSDAQRHEVWRKLGAEYRPRRLQRIARTIALDEVPAAATEMLAGRSRGRTVIRFDSADS
jgi:putative YhdH/YhfP family quinone oxidoreductase